MAARPAMALALLAMLVVCGAQNPLFAVPIPQEMQQMMNEVAGVAEKQGAEQDPFAQLFADVDKALSGAEGQQHAPEPRVVVNHIPARMHVVRVPSLSGLLRRMRSSSGNSEEPQMAMPRMGITAVPLKLPCGACSLSRPMKMLSQLSSQINELPSMHRSGGMKSISISSDGDKTVRTETTVNADGSETTKRIVSQGQPGQGIDLGSMLTSMLDNNMPEELDELFSDKPAVPKVQVKAEKPKRSSPISNEEAKDAVKKALKEESSEEDSGFRPKDAGRMTRQDTQEFATKIAQSLGLNEEDVKVSVKGQEKPQNLAQVAPQEDDDGDENDEDQDQDDMAELPMPKDADDEDDSDDEDEDEEADDKKDAAEELTEEIQEEKEEETDLKQREADTRAAVQAELSESHKGELEAKDDVERAQEKVAEAIKEVRAKKVAANRLQALQQQLESSVVN